MGLKSKLVKGRRRQENLRSGSPSVPKLRGMLLQGDPGMNPKDRPRHLENVRFSGGNMNHRGKIIPVSTTALGSATSCIKDLFDYQTKPRRVYVLYSGCPDISGSTGKTVGWLDFDTAPVLQRGKYYPSIATSFALGTFDGRVLMGADSAVKELTTIVTSYGTESLNATGSAQERTLDTYAGFNVRCIGDFDGKAFLGLDAGAGASKIGTWDGLTSRNDLTAINAPTVFCRFRDKLVVGFGSATNHIRLRAPGDSPGTWTTVSPGAGTVASVHMASYKDNLYISDGAANIWKYDGTTLAIVRTIAGATINAVCSFNGYLYYAYVSAAVHVIIGRFDNTTWTDVHNDLTTTTEPLLLLPTNLVAYRGCLVLLVVAQGPRGLVYISQDQATVTPTVWQRLDPGDIDFSVGGTGVSDAVVL